MNRSLLALLLAVGLASPIMLAQPATTQPPPPKPKIVKPAPKPADQANEPKPTDSKPANPAANQPAEKSADKTADKPTTDEAGPNHKVFSNYEGEWQTEVLEFNDGKSEPAGSGTFTIKAIHAGRNLVFDFDGRLHGKFFRGHAIWGYSNPAKRYESVWCDTSSTSMEIMQGQADPTGNYIRFTGETSDAASGKPVKIREIWNTPDKSHFNIEVFHTPAGGKEAKVMEVHATKGAASKPADNAPNNTDNMPKKGN